MQDEYVEALLEFGTAMQKLEKQQSLKRIQVYKNNDLFINDKLY